MTELGERVRLTAAGAVEALAEAWASIDGKSERFHDGERDSSLDRTDGTYPGYMHEAAEMIVRLERRGFTIAPIPFASQDAAERLRALGWVGVEPVDPKAAIPEPQPGQVWISPRPRMEARTVVNIAPARGWASSRCVYFTWPGSPDRVHVLNPEGWRAWVKKSCARPAGGTP